METVKRFGYIKGTTQRIELNISEADAKTVEFRGKGYYGTVTDVNTNTRYRVYGKSCGLPNCMCDWWLVPEKVVKPST